MAKKRTLTAGAKAARTRKRRATAAKGVRTRKAKRRARKAVQTRAWNRVRKAAQAGLDALAAGEPGAARQQLEVIARIAQRSED